MLFLMMVVIAEITASRGKPGGSKLRWSRSRSHQVITVIAWSVSMLLYIEFASAAQRRDPGGM